MRACSLQFLGFRTKSVGSGLPGHLRTFSRASRFRPIAFFQRAAKQMKSKSYTLFIAANDSGGVRRVRVPLYLIQLLLVLAVVGGITVVAGLGSYSRMLWKVTNYNAMRREQVSLKKQYQQLQTQVSDANDRLNSLQSLAGEVAMAYGITQFRQTPFSVANYQEPEAQYQQTVEEFNYLTTNASLIAATSQQTRLMPGAQFTNLAIVPSL